MSLAVDAIRSLGDAALLVQFEQRIDQAVHRQVMALGDAIAGSQISGVTFLTPAYCSLAVGFDPVQVESSDLERQIRSLATAADVSTVAAEPRLVTIPVCYDEAFGLDLAEVATITGLTVEEVITCHTQQTYRVYMLGFMPGFAYMGNLPKELECPRKSVARTGVPARSVAIAGGQTAIYPVTCPGGWHILGITPCQPFDAETETFLLCPGDEVEFVRISPEELITWEK